MSTLTVAFCKCLNGVAQTICFGLQLTNLYFFRKPESPKSRSRPNFEMKDATPKKQKQCNCKHSKCLKL